MKHLIMVGACYLDTILTVPHYPEEDSKLRATSSKTRRGGNCPNSLEVLQQLLNPRDETRLYLVSTFPARKSAATQRIIASFGEESPIDFETSLYRENHADAASSYILRSQATGSRTLVNHNDLPEMTSSEFAAILQRFNAHEKTWWHFEGRMPDVTIDCIRMIRDSIPAAKISVEIEKPGREGLLELAAEADVVFYSRSWAENRGHSSAKVCLTNEDRPKASLALCAWGADGATAMSQPSGHVIDCPIGDDKKVISVVDSVGAGDTFNAGMLYSLVCHDGDWDIGRSLKFAVNLATAKVQREGFRGLGAGVHVRLDA